jgi:hypothetical protein
MDIILVLILLVFLDILWYMKLYGTCVLVGLPPFLRLFWYDYSFFWYDLEYKLIRTVSNF